jgi:hypothetical protein
VSRGRRIVLGGLVVLLLVAGAAMVVFSRGAYATYPRTQILWPAQQRTAPGWTKPCWPTARWTDKATCAHVSGRVVWIQKHDPDGDGDRHLLVIDRLHPRIVKLSRGLGLTALPRVGARVDAVGWLMRGGSGHVELNTQRFMWAGTTKSTQSGAVLSLIRRPSAG